MTNYKVTLIYLTNFQNKTNLYRINNIKMKRISHLYTKVKNMIIQNRHF